MFDLNLLFHCLISAADGGEQRFCSTLGEPLLVFTGLHGMTVYCKTSQGKTENSFSQMHKSKQIKSNFALFSDKNELLYSTHHGV